LAALSTLPDDQIDTSDAPFRPDAIWVKAADVPHGKKLVSLRLDEDVLDFFRHTGNATKPASMPFCAPIWKRTRCMCNNAANHPRNSTIWWAFSLGEQ
jgi:hypothetical protein